MKKTKLLFAVQPTDAFAPEKPIAGKCSIRLAEDRKRPIRNRSGFYCFTDLAPGTYTVETQAKYYCDKIIVVETDELNPKTPAVNIELEPNLNYSFPKGTTLLRGIIVNEHDLAVSGALVRIQKTDKRFYTDEKGRFIFYFKELIDEEEIRTKLIVTKDGFKRRTKTFYIAKGKTNLVSIDLKPK